MNEALSDAPRKLMSAFPVYALSRVFEGASRVLLHPIITLPILVYLLGGANAQVVWYAVVAGVARGIAAPVAAYIAAIPDHSKSVLAVLLVVQSVGFLTTAVIAIQMSLMSDATLLRFVSVAYLLTVVPTFMLVRLAEHAYEFRKPAAATVVGATPSAIGTLVAAIAIFSILRTDNLGAEEVLAQTILAGALSATAASWLASYRTLFASQLPFPARPMPSVRSPRPRANGPLARYVTFQLAHGVARFADPFLFIALLTLVRPDIVWIGGAIVAFGTGAAVAALLSTQSWNGMSVRNIFTASEFLHTLAIVVATFLPTMLESSLIEDRALTAEFRNWTTVFIGLALGASYLLARDGHRAYIRSISTPQTREVSMVIVGAVIALTAFTPLLAVRLLESQTLETLLRIAAGAAVLAMLATALIVQPYTPPRVRRGAWSLRAAR